MFEPVTSISTTESISSFSPATAKQEIQELFVPRFGHDATQQILESLQFESNSTPLEPIPTQPTPFVNTQKRKQTPSSDENQRLLYNNRWKCQLQYMRKHPTHFTKILTYMLATVLMYFAQQLSANKDRDLKRIDKAIAVSAGILHSYFMAFVTLYLTLNLFFLFVLSKDPSFGIVDTFPNIESTYKVDVHDSRNQGFAYWLFFLGYAPYYILHHVMDRGRPTLSQWARSSSLMFTAAFAATFVLFQSDLLSFNRGLEFLRFDAPTVKTVVDNGPLQNAKVFMWVAVCLICLSAFIDFIVMSKPSFSSLDFLRDPQRTLETWVTHIMKPASTHYFRIIVLFILAVIVWIPFGMFFTITTFVIMAWFGIAIFSSQTFSSTMTKIWAYKEKMILRIFSGLFVALSAINLQDSMLNIRHTTGGPMMAMLNAAVMIISLLFFVLSFSSKKMESGR